MDDVVPSAGQGYEERVRPLRRRDVEDGKRNKSRNLYKRCPPLYVEGETEEIGNRMPEAAHGGSGCGGKCLSAHGVPATPSVVAAQIEC